MTPTVPVLVRGKYVNVEYEKKGGHAVVTKVDGHKVDGEAAASDEVERKTRNGKKGADRRRKESA